MTFYWSHLYYCISFECVSFPHHHSTSLLTSRKKWYPFNQCEIQMSFSIRITSNMKLPARWLLLKLLLECLISARKLIFLLFLLLSQKLYCFVNFVKLYVNLNLSKSKNQQIISQLKGRQMQKMVAPPKKFVN